MLRNGLTHRRPSRWCYSSASRLGVFILFLSLFAGALLSLAQAANQSGLLPAKRLQISGGSEQACLLRLYYLSRHDRNAEAYQLGVAAVAVYPHSPTMRLMTVFAAINTQRYALARPHLDRIARLTTRSELISRRKSLRLACDGVWRRSIDLSMMMGYRPSILELSRQHVIHAEPGSDLYRLCAALKGMCNPDGPFLMLGQRDNGVDIWFQATVNHRWRPDSKWQANLSPFVFPRYASRGGLQGNGIIMRS